MHVRKNNPKSSRNDSYVRREIVSHKQNIRSNMYLPAFLKPFWIWGSFGWDHIIPTFEAFSRKRICLYNQSRKTQKDPKWTFEMILSYLCTYLYFCHNLNARFVMMPGLWWYQYVVDTAVVKVLFVFPRIIIL